MLRDASKSDRKKEVAKLFIEYAYPEIKSKSDMITTENSSLLKNHTMIINEQN